MAFIIIFIACFVCGTTGAWLISRKACQWGLVDVPNLRSSHSHPMPRGGGVGIPAAMALGGIFLARPLWFWGIPALLGVTFFLDDRWKLSIRTRLSFQFAAAGIWVFSSLSGSVFSLQGALLAAFWVIFIVGSANFFNFMDGIDGMAGISGAISFGLLSLYAISRSLELDASFCLLVSAACLGFLPFNFPRPRVFMGDAGSVSLGFVFGAMAFHMSPGPGDFLCLVSFLFLSYVDTVSTLFIRWRSGERLSQAHRRHFYQLLANELKTPHAVVSLAYGGLQLSIGLLMFFLRRSGVVWQLIFLLLLTCCFLLIASKARQLPQVCNPLRTR